ncbi:MAG: prepilin-type N-terminal cleavage/methylation domain-containing protein [Verrucomicrobiales bacterium]
MNPINENRGRAGSSAFTLLELLTVISILSILMAMTIAGISYAQNKAAEEKTRAGLVAIEGGLKQYHYKWGEYPRPIDNSGEGRDGAIALYQALSDDGDDKFEGGDGITSDGREGKNKFTDLKSNGIVAEEADKGWFVIDGFGNPYHYRVYDKAQEDEFHNKGGFDLWSYGDDKEKRKENEAKWIKNW